MKKFNQSSLTGKEIEHVAKLANISLSPAQIKIFQKQLGAVLEFVRRLKEVKTNRISPTSQVTGLKNVFRADKVNPSLTHEQTLHSGPCLAKGYFKIGGISKR